MFNVEADRKFSKGENAERQNIRIECSKRPNREGAERQNAEGKGEEGTSRTKACQP